jgi:hypothetical protein
LIATVAVGSLGVIQAIKQMRSNTP